MRQIPDDKRKMRNFNWMEDKRPKTKFELFEDIKPQPEPAQKLDTQTVIPKG
jgi:hypothetical protein